jgi:hypothetical protein
VVVCCRLEEEEMCIGPGELSRTLARIKTMSIMSVNFMSNASRNVVVNSFH